MPIGNDEAKVNVTWQGSNGDLLEPVNYDLSDRDVKAVVQEAVRSGSVPGIPADLNADFTDFVVDRFGATGDLPNRLVIRSKTPFGALLPGDHVCLKSGEGPTTMTVDVVEPPMCDGGSVHVVCFWFTDAQAYQRARFRLEQLEVVVVPTYDDVMVPTYAK